MRSPQERELIEKKFSPLRFFPMQGELEGDYILLQQDTMKENSNKTKYP